MERSSWNTRKCLFGFNNEIKMHIFIPVFFNAPLGGLQSHVMSQVKALWGTKHTCTIMCKPGPFAESLKSAGVSVLETDYVEIERSIEQAMSAGPFDLVHAHPFSSRAVGISVARKLNIPFLLTFHGMYLDSLDEYGRAVDMVLTVSPAIRNYLIENSKFPAERIFVIPNGVETDVFRPVDLDREEIKQSFPSLHNLSIEPDSRWIFFVSRMDQDKEFILDVVKETWENMVDTRAYDLHWIVAGDGGLRQEMEEVAQETNTAAGKQLITFVGWLDETSLATLTSMCDLAIAPGRSALESMACGVPVIAIGSKGYIGLIGSQETMSGIDTNFGGVGVKHEGYESGAMYRDIDRVIYDDHLLSDLGTLSKKIVSTFFAQANLNDQLLRMYEFLLALGPRILKGRSHIPLIFPRLQFVEKEALEFPVSSWVFPKDDARLTISVSENNSLDVECNFTDDDKIYLISEPGRFDMPPVDPAEYHIAPDTSFEVVTSTHVVAGSPLVQLWVIEYSDNERVAHTNIMLREGRNVLEFISSSETICFKIAFRFSGEGAITINPLKFFKKESNETLPKLTEEDLLRSRELPDFHDYQGENLIFIVGPPRSGTTWLLNLLREHPDVIGATEENLDAKVNVISTLETNVFNKNRPFTDNQIKRKFYLLSKKNSNQVIVEKTPVHLFYVERLRRIFPKAAVILMQRDGRDIVTSLIKVGQDPNSWWKDAPDTLEKATSLWKKYGEETIRCKNNHNPYGIRYENLLGNTSGELARLLRMLGLSTDNIKNQILASSHGRNIPIKGVYREGKTGGWACCFTENDIGIFKETAGDLLERLGYETDDSWGN